MTESDFVLVPAARDFVMSSLDGGGTPNTCSAVTILDADTRHGDPRRAWTIDDMAGEAPMSRSVFFNRFRKEVGVPPMEYLLAWRMALAKNMLSHGHTSVKAIAESVGYASASSFIIAFTRSVGVPPTHFARRLNDPV